MIHVTENELAIITDIIRECAPESDVLVFGSRCTQSPKEYSDLDLAFIAARGRLGLGRISALECAFSDSDLPYRVDVVDYHSADPEFQAIIDSGSERIYSWREVPQ